MDKNVNKILGLEVSKSAKMIMLYELGIEISEVAKLMNVRYNFVYNVVSNKVRMEGGAIRKVEKENKKEKILVMIGNGLSNVEISKELKCNYNYVYGVRKEEERKKELEELKKVK